MKRLNPDQERILLYDCLFCCQRETFIKHYWRLVECTVNKAFALKGIPVTHEGIEDMRNEIFLKLLEKNCKKLWQYKDGRGRSLAGWIIMIANQTILAHFRSKGVLNTASSSILIPLDEAFGVAASEKHPYDLKEQEHIVHCAMDELPAKSRLILKMYYVHELSFETIARYLKMKKGAVYTAKSRALNQLKEKMQKKGENY